jgi:phosphonate transport system substrate-binding protein
VGLPARPAAVSRIAVQALRDAGLRPGEDVHTQHFKTFGSCLHAVLVRQTSVCATGEAALALFEERMRVRLRIMAVSRPIPHMVYVVHRRVPEVARESLRDRILDWASTPEGRELIKGTRHPGFRLVDDHDYEVMRRYESEQTTDGGPAPTLHATGDAVITAGSGSGPQSATRSQHLTGKARCQPTDQPMLPQVC